jgi:hypothetical protein
MGVLRVNRWLGVSYKLTKNEELKKSLLQESKSDYTILL